MSSSLINSLSGGYLQSIFSTAVQGTGLNTSPAGNSVSAPTSTAIQPDNSQLSPFARLASALQQIQLSNPAKYQQVTNQIAANLQSAAQKAQSEGNTAASNLLTQLATDFTNASKTGQLPNLHDLAQAAGGHHHGHHHAQSNSAGAANSGVSGSGNQTVDQLLSSLQTTSDSDNALNPAQIILSTLSNAGVTGINS